MAYKALKAARRMPSGRDAMRMMQKMGMQLGELEEVTQVVIETQNKRIVIDKPSVATITMQGQQVYQVTGGQVREESAEQIQTVLDEDIELVSQQAMVSSDEARKAILQANGDLAQAIILLKEKKT